MKKRMLAMVLAVALLLCGCLPGDLSGYPPELLQAMGIYNSELEYTRPDMERFQQVLADACALAEESLDVKEIIQGVYDFYDVYDEFATAYALSNIYYCGDLTDIYWEQEYNYCSESLAQVDAGLETLYYALAKSPMLKKLEDDAYFGEGFFDAYQGESLYDDAFVALLEQEAALVSDYYALTEEMLDSVTVLESYQAPATELLIRLVKLRREIAAYAGYDSYVDFAYEFQYAREYSPEEAAAYLRQVGVSLQDVYSGFTQEQIWALVDDYCPEEETLNYVKKTAKAMGGSVWKAYELLEKNRLSDTAYGANKMDGAFEVFLPSYGVPYIFMSPYLDQTDKLTLTHEFGHFCNDFVCRGSSAGMDVAEVQSQGMEYLSLCYGDAGEELTAYKLVDGLTVYMHQSVYALFEQQLYGLPEEGLTMENIEKLYRQTGESFGLPDWSWDSRDYILLSHIYMEPLYLVSYVVSNDLALQIYQAELADAGTGLAMYEKCLESQESRVLTFARDIGLESPFAEHRLEAVEQTFREALKKIM